MDRITRAGSGCGWIFTDHTDCTYRPRPVIARKCLKNAGFRQIGLFGLVGIGAGLDGGLMFEAAFTGRLARDPARVDEAVVGRRGGKSRATATLATYIAGLCEHPLARERGVPVDQAHTAYLAIDEYRALMADGARTDEVAKNNG